MSTNWAGNYAYRAARVHRPTTIAELSDLVARSDRVKILGTRHSFNDIADTTGDLISLENFNRVLSLDAGASGATVTIEAGVTYGQLARHLHAAGYALPNLASLPQISVAGVCATATHGSGDGNGILATSVAAMEVVMGSGEVCVFSRGASGDTFCGAVVALGGIAAVVKLKLDVVPAFDVRQQVYENLPFAAATAHLDEIFRRSLQREPPHRLAERHDQSDMAETARGRRRGRV